MPYPTLLYTALVVHMDMFPMPYAAGPLLFSAAIAWSMVITSIGTLGRAPLRMAVLIIDASGGGSIVLFAITYLRLH